jgi:hypothetical protein
MKYDGGYGNECLSDRQTNTAKMLNSRGNYTDFLTNSKRFFFGLDDIAKVLTGAGFSLGNLFSMLELKIEWTFRLFHGPARYTMSVNHRRGDIEERLDRADIVICLQ